MKKLMNAEISIKSKFFVDAAWNYGAFGVMAATGVILNFFIAAYFGIEALGVFNQIYAVYVISAQFAVMGFHDSAQKYISEHGLGPENIGVVSAAALALVSLFGLLTALCIYLLSGPIGVLVESKMVGKGIALAAPGVMFFAINKVLMGILNGVQRMKAYAGVQTLRVSVILISCLGIAWLGFPAYMFGLSFAIAEIVLLPTLLVLVGPHPTYFSSTEAFKSWIRVHFHFGSRAVINGLLAQTYIRVDIIMLGILLFKSF